VNEVTSLFDADFRTVTAGMFNNLSMEVTMNEDYPKFAINYAMLEAA